MITINLNGNTSSISVDIKNLTSKQALEIGMALESLASSFLTPEDYQTQFIRETCEQYPENKLMAIKIIKDKFNNLSLREAKDFADACFDKMNLNKLK